MKFDKLAELAGDIQIDEETQSRILRNCKKEYEERQRRKLLFVSLLSVLVQTR